MQIRNAVFPDDRAALQALVEAVTTVDGISPLGEPAEMELARGLQPGSFGIVIEAQRPIAYLHVAATSGELAIDPRHREPAVVRRLLDGGLHEATARGSELGVWTHTDEIAGLVGTAPDWFLDRVLLRMRAPLPPADRPELPAGVVVRGFRVGTDEAAWLAVNNAAFEDHPEQGAWSRADLDRRLAWEWFDPEGLRMAWDGDRLAGFNWTKVHDGGVGEIFIIAASPDHQGQGLGRALALEGLWDLWSRQGVKAATLYVDADNRPARELYEDLGFDTIETHRHFRPVSR